ncbi:hypothetical protein [Actinoplanes subtropicus]|uniref:hypothetical protein n=1 Tax=Actinoplanes subtropicus TaxID=543632 RepID=UPI0004C36573|nr:hypothetical protein [Actinoplanes subtropicus]
MATLPRRPAALLAAGLALLSTLAGCATATTVTAATTATATTSAANARPPATAIPSPAAPTSKAPTLTNTGTTWPKIVGSLTTYGQWLLANPNPALAAAITVPGCAADNALTAELQARVNNGTYVQPAAPILVSISGPTGSIGGQVIVDIRAVRGAEPVYYHTRPRSTTHVVSDRPALPPTDLSLTLIRGSDSRWRLCTASSDQNPDTEALTSLL